MNQQEILDMEAGPEMDVLIAEKVIGCKVEAYSGTYICKCEAVAHGTHDYLNNVYYIRPYSTQISAAWEVAEKMTDYEMHIMSGLNFKRYPDMPYGAKFENKKISFVALGATAPLAICRAALLAAMSR